MYMYVPTFSLLVYSSGLFPLLGYSSMSVRPTLLDIYERYYLSVGQGLVPCLPGMVLGLLPGLEDESEHTERCVLVCHMTCIHTERCVLVCHMTCIHTERCVLVCHMTCIHTERCVLVCHMTCIHTERCVLVCHMTCIHTERCVLVCHMTCIHTERCVLVCIHMQINPFLEGVP